MLRLLIKEPKVTMGQQQITFSQTSMNIQLLKTMTSRTSDVRISGSESTNDLDKSLGVRLIKVIPMATT